MCVGESMKKEQRERVSEKRETREKGLREISKKRRERYPPQTAPCRKIIKSPLPSKPEHDRTSMTTAMTTSSFSVYGGGVLPATKTVNHHHHSRGRNNKNTNNTNNNNSNNIVHFSRATSSTSSSSSFSLSGGCASCCSSSSKSSKSVLRRRRSSFRVRATGTVEGENEEEQVKSDGNNNNNNNFNNFNGGDDQFKRAPGEDQEKFQKSVADSPFSRKRIQPLPSKFGVSDRAAGAKQNLPFNQTTNRAGKDAPTSSSSSSAGESSSFAAAAAARSPFDNVSPPKSAPPTPPKSPFAASSAAASTSTPSSPFAKVSSATNASASPMAPMKPAKKVKNPFNEPDAATYGAKPMKVDKPKEVKFEIPKVSFGQIFIVLSFTTIIGLMIGTFWVVWNSGGIRFNET